MKLTLSLTIVLLMASAQLSAQGVFDRIKQSATDKVNQRVDGKTNTAIDRGLDSAEDAWSSRAKPKSSQTAAADVAPAADSGNSRGGRKCSASSHGEGIPEL